MRAVVNVATGAHYVKGQERLTSWCAAHGEDYMHWRDNMPPGSPAHRDVPYAFKAFALKAAIDAGFTTLLWADSSIIPVQPLAPLWERIERDGYWIGRNGWTNYEWTADSAYPDLFKDWNAFGAREANRQISHVVATAFGVNIAHPAGREIFDTYFFYASETKAFCGPWTNANAAGERENLPRVGCCGPPDVRGHRHDQTALSVIAWHAGCQLTNSPDVFAYGKRGAQHDPRTILLADGSNT